MRCVKKKIGVAMTLIPMPISVTPCIPPWLYHFLDGPVELILGADLGWVGEEGRGFTVSGASVLRHIAWISLHKVYGWKYCCWLFNSLHPADSSSVSSLFAFVSFVSFCVVLIIEFVVHTDD